MFKFQNLAHEFLSVVERVAIATARTIGHGDRHHSDHVAVSEMRSRLKNVSINGRIVIGEGERDKAPMLHIGECVGQGGSEFPDIDIAVDPLEGTNLCAIGAPGAVTVLAASEQSGLLQAPDIYMQKLIVGPQSKDAVCLDAPVVHNLHKIAKCLGRDVSELVIVVLDRRRHESLIADIRATGAQIRLISDGDLMTGIATAKVENNIHAVMGIGGAPEGVLTAAAMRCCGGEIFGRLIIDSPQTAHRARSLGINNLQKVYSSMDLASGKQIIFAASGITDGVFMKGVRFTGTGCHTSSMVMQTDPHCVRFIDTTHIDS